MLGSEHQVLDLTFERWRRWILWFTLKVCLFKHVVITIQVCEAEEMQLWNETGCKLASKYLHFFFVVNKMNSHKIADGRKSLEMVSRSLIEVRNEKESASMSCILCMVVNFLLLANVSLNLVRKSRFKVHFQGSCDTRNNFISFWFHSLIHFSRATNINSTMHSSKRWYFKQFYSYFLRLHRCLCHLLCCFV